MTFDHPTPAEDAAGDSGLSRRSLVRTGAIGAVAVPAITIASAAPALAATTSATDSGATTLAANLQVFRANKKLRTIVTITNSGTYKTLGLSVSLTYKCLSSLPVAELVPVVGGLLGGSLTDATSTTPAGWSVFKTGSMVPLVGNLTESLLGSVTFRFVAQTQLAPGQTVVLEPTITVPAEKPLYLVGGTANPGSGLPAILGSISL
ncbi:hypothetical protein K8Z61_10520 [Nocardioides sp. TRM66260-LWL]|uniref:hypothetical protein n=1 Tax=Nocardioides sp. TRM66260-LWL TaxID=2874478 RepID=UPI001CC77AC8|nr:hypothetical protein [Nocardioides sp. TRM66260-LWL]MBZ5734930.1 hypothetical protein [Nocardioides sp. TRM66260-LWL]